MVTVDSLQLLQNSRSLGEQSKSDGHAHENDPEPMV